LVGGLVAHPLASGIEITRKASKKALEYLDDTNSIQVRQEFTLSKYAAARHLAGLGSRAIKLVCSTNTLEIKSGNYHLIIRCRKVFRVR
jgi:hypothetical protein